MGWFDGLFGGAQYGPNPLPPPAPEYSFQDALRAAREQQLYSSLLSAGGQLLAAGQPMHPNQRAQILAHAAQSSGQAFDPMRPMQTAMFGMQANKMQQDAERQKAFQQMLMTGMPTGQPGAMPPPGVPLSAPPVGMPAMNPGIANPMMGAAPQAMPPAGMPPASPPGAVAPLQMLQQMPPQMRAAILGMPADQQATALFNLYAKQQEIGQWQPAEEGGVKGQRNRFTGEFKPFSPNAQPGVWKDIGGGMQQNSITGERKPVDPSLVKQSIGVNLPPQQTEEQKKVGGFYGDTYTDLQKAAIQAPAKIGKLDQIETLLNKAYTGTGAETWLDLKKAAQGLGLGIDLPENIGAAEAAKALSNEMALQLRNPAGGAGMPGALSDPDRQFLVSMTPGMAQTPQGRKQLIDAHRKIAERDQDVAKMARDYRKKNGQIDEGFFDVLAEYAEKHPLFPKAATAPGMPSVGSVQQGYRFKGGNPADQNSWERVQ